MSTKIFTAVLALVMLMGIGVVSAAPAGPACCGSPVGTPYPDVETCSLYCYGGCYACDFSEFGYDCEGYYGYQYSCPQPSGDSDSNKERLLVDFDSGCDELVVTVTSGGDAVNNAHVSVKDVDTADLLASGDTDSQGEAIFEGLFCDMKVDVKATKSGYKSDTATDELIECAQCAAPECTEDTQCPSDERCSDGSCVSIPCECGYVENRECVPYQCCSADDCPQGQDCLDNTCVGGDDGTPESEFQCMSDADCGDDQYCDIAVGAAGGTCEPVTGDCGYVENHMFVSYECGDDAACPSCPTGASCVDHACTALDITCPTSAVLGDEVTCVVTDNGEPCRVCEVVVTGPDGRQTTYMTDENGNVVLPSDVLGDYNVQLMKNGQPVADAGFQVTGGDEPGDDGAAGDDGQHGDSGVMSWLLLLILLVLLAVGVGYLAKNNR